MDRLRRAAGAAAGIALRLLPAERRDWARARLGGIVRSAVRPQAAGLAGRRAAGVATGALTASRIGRWLAFAVAAALTARVAWPGSPDGLFTVIARMDLITVVLLLAGLPWLMGRASGLPGDCLLARLLRVGGYGAVLAFTAAKARLAAARAGSDRAGVFSSPGSPRSCCWSSCPVRGGDARGDGATVSGGPGHARHRHRYGRSRLVWSCTRWRRWDWPRTPPIRGCRDRISTRSWRWPGSCSLAARWRRRSWPGGATADRATRTRSTRPGSGSAARPGSSRPGSARLIVAVLGTGTVALMPRAAWLRHWLYPGRHLLAAAVHSRELTAINGSGAYGLILIAFPIIGLFLGIFSSAAVVEWSGPPPGGGGPAGPEPVPGPPGSGRPGRRWTRDGRVPAALAGGEEGQDNAQGEVTAGLNGRRRRDRRSTIGPPRRPGLVSG